jgi:hypothetical protein
VCILSLPRDLSRLRSVSNSNTRGRAIAAIGGACRLVAAPDSYLQTGTSRACIPGAPAVRFSSPTGVSGMEQGVCKSWMRSTIIRDRNKQELVGAMYGIPILVVIVVAILLIARC